LHAKLLGKPLYQVLGGESPVVTVGADFGVRDSIDDLLKEVRGAVDAGYRRVKLKFRPGWDVPMLEAVRREFPTQVFHIDCNSGYRLGDVRLFQDIDRFNLAMIEQPLGHDDLLDHAALQKQIRTPVCLDESITSLAKARKALVLGSCRYVNIKPGRVGGLTVAVAIHDVCHRAGMPCWVGGMLESAVGAAHCIALATLPAFTYPADIFPSTNYYREDLAEPPLVLSGVSEMTAHDRPGIGVEPHPERLRKQTISQASI
jgi:O-succinylbenzoate synthase